MHQLTAAEIDGLDSKIDGHVPSFNLLSRTRDSALLHLLRYYDVYEQGCASIPNPGEREIANKHSLDGLNHAVRWVFQFCPQQSHRPKLGLDEAAYREAQELFGAAQDYSKMWDLMTMLHRGMIVGILENDCNVRLSFASELEKALDIADGLVAGPYSPEVLLGEPVVTPSLCDAILGDVNIRNDLYTGLRYTFSDSLFNAVSERVDQLTSGKCELPTSWDFGGYTVGDYRRFCVALDSLCLIHQIVCYAQANEQKRIESIVRFINRDEWHQELARRTWLRSDVVSAILDDLVYDPALHALGHDRPPAHISFQPLFDLGRNIVGVSNWLVHTSNAERNAFELMSLKRPVLYSNLQNLKEAAWIDELCSTMPSLGVNVYPRLRFDWHGKSSDLDALLLDEKNKFGLVCELKWLRIPGRIAQSVYNDREIRKGIEQAKQAYDWVQASLPELASRIGIALNDLAQYQLQPLLLSKNYLASGWLSDSEVPVMNERLFNWVIGEPHHKSLKAVWRVANERRYLPQKGKHFEDLAAASVEFGGVHFALDGLAYALKDPWDPRNDIDVEDLD